tara:strand:+ start:2273 stop:2566 length:294 start_codon:yes stop_codon:yes gene_type:complete
MAKTTTIDYNNKDELILEQKEDVSSLVEQNKKEYNAADTKWSDQLFGNKVASIPNIAIDKLNQEGIMRGFEILDQKRFFAWLNDRDNVAFRTKPGRL